MSDAMLDGLMDYADSRIQRVADQLGCSFADALTYLELRDEGYSQYQAKLMTGLIDSPDDDASLQTTKGK